MKQLIVYVNDELHEDIRQLAFKQNVSRASLLRNWIKCGMEKSKTSVRLSQESTTDE